MFQYFYLARIIQYTYILQFFYFINFINDIHAIYYMNCIRVIEIINIDILIKASLLNYLVLYLSEPVEDYIFLKTYDDH